MYIKRILFYLFLLSATLQATDQVYPAVAFDGENFLVVWEEAGPDAKREIFGKRADMAGNYIDQQPIMISPPEHDAYAPNIVFTSEYFISWVNENTNAPHCARVSTSGTVVDNSIEIPDQQAYGTSKPTIAFDGTNLLHVHVPHYPVYCTMLSQSGEIVSLINLGTHDCSQEAKVTFGGENYLVVWKDFG
jgi:hypothetical protein